LIEAKCFAAALVALGYFIVSSHALVLIPNGDFSNGTNNWRQAGGGPGFGFSYPTTGGSGGGGYGSIGADAGSWAILVSPVAEGGSGGGWAITTLGITAGVTNTFSIDLKTTGGFSANGGMKVEAWGGNIFRGDSGDRRPGGAAFTEWTTYTFDWLVPATTDKLVFVPLWAGPNLSNVVGVDNIGVLVTNSFTGSGNWSATNSWANGVAAVNGSSVLFSGAGGASTNNNAVDSVSGVTFAAGAGAYTVSGDSLTVGTNGIVNNSANVQTVSNALALGNTLTVSAASNAIVLGGNITGSNGIIKTGASTLTLSGANSYSGATTVGGGTLRIDGNARLGNTNTTLTISNAGIMEVTAAGTITNAITIGAGNGVLSNASSSGMVVFATNVSKNGTVLTSRSGSGTNVFAGKITGTEANSDFVVDGGTTVFSNVMTYNGPTIITNGGTLVLAVDDAMPSGSDLILGGGTFLVDVENYNADSSLSMGTLTLSENSTIDFGDFGTSGDRILKFANSSAINWNTNAVLTITNWQGVAATQSDVTKLLFGTGGLDSDQLAQIQFAGYEQGAALVGGELAPIPEAPVVWGAAALAGFIFWRERGRVRQVLGAIRPGSSLKRGHS
jgi:autotransporter-associated beta strand protein